MGGSYYLIPCSILSTGKDGKTPQRYPDVPTTSWRISIRSMDSGTIDQSAGGKLRDHNTKESWALLDDLALYDNESWNDPRNFAKPVKAIALPQDVPSLLEVCCKLLKAVKKQTWVKDLMGSRCMESNSFLEEADLGMKSFKCLIKDEDFVKRLRSTHNQQYEFKVT
ncbi:hypothetical protein Tco_0223054 [Tanacetum coccineum]